MKKWRCTVCGYIHTGEQPPEKCPVCKADRDKFVEVIEATTPPEPKPAITGLYARLTDLLYKNHAHPILVHYPNGVLPVAVLFTILAMVLGHAVLATAAFYNLIFVLLVMPMVIFSGFISWQKRYKGIMTKTFSTKILCGFIVIVTALILVGWHQNNPTILSAPSAARWLFLLVHLVMLAAAGIAGHLGGKLVFGNR